MFRSTFITCNVQMNSYSIYLVYIHFLLLCANIYLIQGLFLVYVNTKSHTLYCKQLVL